MIDLTPEHRESVAGRPIRDAVVWLLCDPAGPLGDCAARDDDAPAAYMLGLLYRHGRAAGVLRGRPGYEAVDLFSNRVRTATRRSLDPFEWMVNVARMLGLRWESIPEIERVRWRGAARDLARAPDGVRLTTEWTRIRQPARLNDLITSAVIAADWIGVLREAARVSGTNEIEKEPT